MAPKNTETPEERAHPEKCEGLANTIQRLRDELAKRTDELVEDKYKLPATGKMSIKSHQDEFQKIQKALRERIKDFNDSGCGGALPYDAWDLATNPVPAPGKRNLPIHQIITPAPRTVVPVVPVPAVQPELIPFFWPLPVMIIKCIVARDCGQGSGQG